MAVSRSRHRLVLAGAFVGERVELLAGALIEAGRQGSRHA